MKYLTKKEFEITAPAWYWIVRDIIFQFLRNVVIGFLLGIALLFFTGLVLNYSASMIPGEKLFCNGLMMK